MQLRITAPSQIDCRISLPASKSICNRALVLDALAGGKADIGNLSDCDDTRVMVDGLRSRGDVVDIGAAGTAMRFLTAFFAVQPDEQHLMTGTARMQQRPIRILVDALRSLGADIEYTQTEGFPPLLIHGRRLTASEVSLPGDVSSQYISALLMIGATLPEGLTLHLTGDIISRPYIDLTLRLMTDFGGQVRWMPDGRSVRVEAHAYSTRPYTVESDWSAASYWYEMAALSREAQVELPGLLPDSPQGDSAVAQLFGALGVKTDFNGAGAVLGRMPRALERMDYDFTNQPDLAQTFVVTCALLGLPFRFSGLQSLKIKETDRMEALRIELRKLGYAVREEEGSVLAWDGERVPADPCPVIDTYEDHRMAMAFAPAALCLPEIRINHPQVVSKSYPHYWDDLRRAGFHLEEL